MRANLGLVLVLGFALVLFGQAIAECEQMPPQERDGCYLGKSVQPDQCANILDPKVRDQCFLAIAEQHARTYRDCDRLYAQYQPLCYSRLAYGVSKSSMSCEDLPLEFREYCYFYFADKNSGGKIAACEAIPPQYKQGCLEEFFKKTLLQSESDCSAFGERYRGDCAKYVGSKSNPISFSLSFIEGAIAFLTSPNVVAGASFVVILVILLFFLRVANRGMRKERQGLK